MLTTSVIVCTRNRLKDLTVCLSALAHQTEKITELIIVDSSDSPVTKDFDFEQRFNQKVFGTTALKYLHTSPGLTYQRNVGISQATGDIIYFFDDDSIPEPDYITQMNSIFACNPAYGGGMGSVINMGPQCSWRYRWIRPFFLLQRDYACGKFTLSGMPTHPYGLTDFKEVEVLGGCCMAYRREVIARHLFDERLERYAYMEDCDASCRVARESLLFYNPRARLAHMASPLARDRVVDNRAMFIKNYSYLFFKNFYPHNKFKLLFYGWSVLGLFVEALLLRNRDYLAGYIKGLKNFYYHN